MFARLFRHFGAASLILIVAGGVFAARPLVHLIRRTHAAVSARAEWARWIRSEKSMAGTGEPAGWMTIASAGIDTIVLWGDTRENLQRYPCLSLRSISFDQPDSVKVVAAHRDTHFRSLGKVSTGDSVRIFLKDRRVLEYRVCDIEIVPKDLVAERISGKDGDDWLVLLTCYPFSMVGPAPDRLIIWARPERSRPGNRKNVTPPTLRAGGRPFSFLPSPSMGERAFPSLVSSLPSGRAAPFAIRFLPDVIPRWGKFN